MFDATVETTTTYRLSVKQIEDIIFNAAGIERGPGVYLQFNVSDATGIGTGYYDDDPYQPASLNGATITITKKERK
jgi:hypothetical protein